MISDLHKRWEEEMKVSPCIETASGVIYFEPSEDGTKILFGGVTNTGLCPTGEIEYEPDESLDYHIQGLVEKVFEMYGYPEGEYDE